MQAQTLTTLLSFTGTGGALPAGALAQGPDGNFYGTTESGGVFGFGTVFRVTSGGALTTLHSFNGQSDGWPCGGLTLGTDGNFYGIVCSGSTGAVFKITPTGTLTVLHTFSGAEGAPIGGMFFAALTLGTDGDFYGTTPGGIMPGTCGGNHPSGCGGTVFRITPPGTFTTLYSFSGADGADPVAALTLGADGNFYGTTEYGGTLGLGSIFRITPGGTLTTLHYFSTTGGIYPLAGLTLGADGAFYGTTASDFNGGPSISGAVFRMTPDGVLTTLHTFSSSGAEGSEPSAALTLGADGNFYGTTRFGGAYGYGAVFRVTPSGTLTTLYSFNGADGENPVAPLTLGADGSFYGTTQYGGANHGGTFFSLNVANSPLSVNANGVVNAASNGGPVAPGSIAAVFGTFLVPNPTSSAILPLPTTLSGLSLHFGTVLLAPLFFGSPSQVNAQVPWELAGQTQTTVFVSQNGQSSATRMVPLAMYAPGIFVTDSQTSQGAILDANYRLVSPANPTTPGADVQIYCTGLGPVTSQPATGAPALANPLSWTTTNPTVTIGGAPASMLFSGLVPGSVGLYQVNAQVPTASTRGPAVPLMISVGGVTSNVVYLAIQ
jgi:uncharacterized protein (TIGR03437 family)